MVGFGVEPGMADVFARYAADHISLMKIQELGIRDGANITIEGYEFAPNFSIWTTIDVNPPVYSEEGKGWFTTAPSLQPEIFDLLTR